MPRILLIISGSIAAYKGLELIRLLRLENVDVKVILTSGGAQFITPLSCAVLSGNPVSTDLFSLTEETEMGHIRLAREAEMVVIAPATADLIAKAVQGRADDLASTVLLATTAPLLMAPAMNVEMWHHPATQANFSILTERGVHFIGPDEGELACGERGLGKMTDPSLICKTIMDKLRQSLNNLDHLSSTIIANPSTNSIPATLDGRVAYAPPNDGGGDTSLKGKKVLVTAGPTREPIDPVRYLSNSSSGKQGYAIAEALLKKGAEVILITGPSSLTPPKGAHVVAVQTAEEMWKATESHLPVNVAICSAAVADWRVETISSKKMKKENTPSSLSITLNRDVLASLAKHALRPELLIGFAAETENVIENGKIKLSKCDWILANDVSLGVIGSDHTQIHFLTPEGCETWGPCPKKDIANLLVARCEGALK